MRTRILPDPREIETRNKHDQRSDRPPLQDDRLRLRRDIPGKVLESGQPLFIHDNFAERTLPHNAEEGLLAISSLIAVPFLVGGKVHAVLLVAKNKPGTLFTDMDYIHMQTFADYAGLMLDHMIQYIEVLEKRETATGTSPSPRTSSSGWCRGPTPSSRARGSAPSPTGPGASPATTTTT
jgi:hypothetical protein